MTYMQALNSPNIRHGEFIKLTTSTTSYYFCNAAGPITVPSVGTFSNLGALLSVGTIERNIKANSADMVLSLMGIDPNNISIILSTPIKGSLVEVWRGFFDSNNQIITTPSIQFFKRYTGLINNVSVTEDWNEAIRSRVATCTISCTSIRKILENRVGGIKTNRQSWNFLYPTDSSMDRVEAITNQYFDFGKTPTSGGVSSGGGGYSTGTYQPYQAY